MGNPQLAIHDRKGSFSDRWIEYCNEHDISYRIVDCCSTDVISQLTGSDALLWHWHLGNPEDNLIARHVICSAELMGLKVFPDSPTCWTYDNKIAQKYILESIGAPLVPTCIFYDQHNALDWASKTSFPKVFKLSRGAGSKNVRLVRNVGEAKALIRQAFGRGFNPVGGHFREVMGGLGSYTDRNKLDLTGKLKRLPQSLKNIYISNKYLGREKGYIYFQDFIPDNQFDIRITVIGHRAFGFTRNVRENDFRASGSGKIVYDSNRIKPECIKIAFDVAKKLSAQSIALDFVLDTNSEPKLTEISYCYVPVWVYKCPGYWDSDLKWHEEQAWPQDLILIDLLDQLSS